MGAIDEWIANAILVHSLNLLRFSAGVQAKIVSLLTAMQKELAAKLSTENLTDFGKQRLNTLLRESNGVIATYYGQAQTELARNLSGLVKIETGYAAKVLTQAFKIDLGAGLPPATYLDKLVGDTLIKGAASSTWWDKQKLDMQFRFAGAVRQGAAQGETTADIVGRVIGKNGVPGIMQVTRSNATSLVHTSVQAVANAARLATFKANADLIECLVWLSTLDTHTCLLCAERDLEQYTLEDQQPIGHELPWDGGPGAIHFACRCAISTKSKSFKELGLDVPEPAPSQRAARGGPVAGDLNFKDWLASKDTAFREEYLGPGRAELYEAGKITLSDLLDQRGNRLTLEELRAKYKEPK